MIKLHDIKLFAYLWKMHGCIFLINWEIVSLKALTITFFLNCNGKKIIVSSNTAKILVVSRKSYHHIETFFWVSKRFERQLRVYSSRCEVDLHYGITYLQNFEKKIRQTFEPKRNCSSMVSVGNTPQKVRKRSLMITFI